MMIFNLVCTVVKTDCFNRAFVMPNIFRNVQESDTRGGDSSTTVGKKKNEVLYLN